MKFNYKKVASVLASAIMLSSTVGFAAAASNYPAPFVAGGSANGAVIVGASAAISDWSAAIDVQQKLNALVTSSTTTTGASATGGDSINLATSARKLYYLDAINVARSSISSTEMPNVLADGKVIDLKGTEYKYTQTVVPGTVATAFGTSGGDLNDPALYVDVGTTPTTAQLYNYTLSFTKNINVSDDVNVQGQKIKILGVDYVIGTGSTNNTLYLYGSGETVTLAGGESKTVTIAGTEHTVELTSTSSTTTAKITVDGVSKTVTKSSSYAFSGDINVFVKDVTHPAYAGDVRNVELIIGANTLLLQSGQTVKQGADQTTVKGSYATITAAGNGLISGLTVSVAAPKTQTDSLATGESLSDPVFGGLKVQFAGPVPQLNDTGRSKVVVETDNNQYGYVTFTSARGGAAGEKKLAYVYDNDTNSASVQPQLAHQALAANKGNIHVLEGESALVNDWIVVNQGDSGTILNVDDISIDTATSGTVTFSDVITGDSQKITLTNSSGVYTKTGVNFFGGTGYTVSVPNAGTSVNITWSGAGITTLFPRIKLKDGGWIAFLEETTLANNTGVIFPDGQTNMPATAGATILNTTVNAYANGITWGVRASGANAIVQNISSASGGCNFNATKGPAILYLEPKKWNDGSFGDFICIPLTTTGTTEIAIGTPTINGTNAGFQSYQSDNYKTANIDKFGTFVTMESRTNENGVATLNVPSSQMYMDVLFTADTATVTPGTVVGGSGGQVLVVKDTEVDSVKDKNLLVVGGSCINSVAAKILGSDNPVCGDDFSALTKVSAGGYIIKTVESPYNAAKVAMLVAGYNADDTTNAVSKALTGVATDKATSMTYPEVTTGTQ
ncbi:Uncharacterised protein [uncultured archaeon]|nr:Uncharacterised protein [uncultured archaeon]